ncbi:sulfotransferase [Bacillus sp. JCM 19034]|uniref:sulfotransferase n=1 Tax=Bacillus sp. JCM 19034 TaxID=1481928 RepID=UPI0007808A04|nr:sulfotransferase [Bacillus sp. JCM 19034]
MKSHLFLLLCLHRSGSSATAGVLNELGIHMGNRLLGSSEYNQKGHFENRKIVNLNNAILRSVNHSWNTPPSRELVQTTPFTKKEIVNRLSSEVYPFWGLKDPRTLLTLDVLLPALKQLSTITYVFVHRPFQSSVNSLAKRNRYPKRKARKILQTYLDRFNYYRNESEISKDQIIDIEFNEMIKDPTPYVHQINSILGKDQTSHLNRSSNFLTHN